MSAVCDEEIVVILRSRPDSLLTAFCVLVRSERTGLFHHQTPMRMVRPYLVRRNHKET